MPKKQTEQAESVEESAEVAYYYLSEHNPDNASYPGVPLCDLLTEQVETYPKWIQKSLKASKMYRPAYTLTGEGEGDKE